MSNPPCHFCKDTNHPIWARTFSDNGTLVYACRVCWEDQYPCDMEANFVKIPYRMKCCFGWMLSAAYPTVTLQPGDYEIGKIDAHADVLTLWVYGDEFRLVDRSQAPHIPITVTNALTHELLKSKCTHEPGYLPFVTLYSFVKRYGIFYRKESHIRKAMAN